jgi:hypothetical protein
MRVYHISDNVEERVRHGNMKSLQCLQLLPGRMTVPVSGAYCQNAVVFMRNISA